MTELPFPKSLPDFQRLFPDDAACAKYLEQVRFRHGFVCPSCGAKLGYEHLPVAEKGDPKVAEEYLPIVHLIFSNLKSWLLGVHHGVGPQHLQAYLDEFTFRFNRRFYPFNAFRSLLGIAADTEAHTYADLYARGDDLRESA